MSLFSDAPAKIPSGPDFAASWLAAWNAHDLPRILAHYRADAVLCSPMIARIQGSQRECLTGHAAIADYWAAGLKRFEDLHFTLITVLQGVDGLMIYYRGVRQQPTAEVLGFDAAGLVCRAAVYYPEGVIV